MKKFLSLALLSSSFLLASGFGKALQDLAAQKRKDLETVSRVSYANTVSKFEVPVDSYKKNERLPVQLRNARINEKELGEINADIEERNKNVLEKGLKTTRNIKFYEKEIAKFTSEIEKLQEDLRKVQVERGKGNSARLAREEADILQEIENLEGAIQNRSGLIQAETERARLAEEQFEKIEEAKAENQKKIETKNEIDRKKKEIMLQKQQEMTKNSLITDVTEKVLDVLSANFNLTEDPSSLKTFKQYSESCLSLCRGIDADITEINVIIEDAETTKKYKEGAKQLKVTLKDEVKSLNDKVYQQMEKGDYEINVETLFYSFLETYDMKANEMIAVYETVSKKELFPSEREIKIAQGAFRKNKQEPEVRSPRREFYQEPERAEIRDPSPGDSISQAGGPKSEIPFKKTTVDLSRLFGAKRR
jgi:hypothetical protein